VKATGRPQDRLEKLLASDEGARSIGEFSFGFNPHILRPMLDTLFDEKIAGSLHFTPDRRTRWPTTATARRSTGIWC
jgi:aminopeptidase